MANSDYNHYGRNRRYWIIGLYRGCVGVILGLFRGYIGVFRWFYWDYGKENETTIYLHSSPGYPPWENNAWQWRWGSESYAKLRRSLRCAKCPV